MTPAEIIAASSKNSELPFLVIGGLAVIAHGYPRDTVDLDYLVRRSDREAWIRALVCQGYGLAHEHENFAQFTSEPGGTDVDLMFVNDSTFDAMFAASTSQDTGVSQARFPSLEHLVALKLHVLKQGLRHRALKDMDDVSICSLPIAWTCVRKTGSNCSLNTVTRTCMKKSPEPSLPESGFVLHDHPAGVPELDLPNAPDFVSRRSPMTLAQVLPLLEERRKMFPTSGKALPAHWRQPVSAEFVL